MSAQDDTLRPEEFAEASIAVIENALGKPASETALLLAQAGLMGVCVPEAQGGLGLDIAFAVPLAHAAGKLRFQFPLIEQVLMAKALSGTSHGELLATGEKLAGIAFQGQLMQGWVGGARHANLCDWVLVFEGQEAVLVSMSDVSIEEDQSLDPDYPQHWLEASNAQVILRLDAAKCEALWRDAQILMSAWVNGAAEGAFEDTASYLSTRVQFGRPLTAKQAVRHTFSRMKLAQEATAAAIQRVLSSNELGQVRTVDAVFVSAIQNATWVIEKAIHLQGGMGFTWDVPLHYALREVRKIEAMFGSSELAIGTGREWIEANSCTQL